MRAATTALALLLASAYQRAASLRLDPGPTYGQDYAGGDYNVTEWHSPANMSADHWQASPSVVLFGASALSRDRGCIAHTARTGC